MGLIEDSLRETFAAVTAAPPATQDAAGRAIRSARGIRRRGTAIGAAAVVVSVLLTGAGVVTVLGGPSAIGVVAGGPPAPTSPPPTAPPTDVLVGNDIVQATGRVVSLAALPEIRRGWQVPGGWLVETRDQRRQRSAVWFVDGAGSPRSLAEGDRVTVGKGTFAAPRVAWGNGDVVQVATFSGGELISRAETDGVQGFGPVAVVGTGVLLERADGSASSYDMWFPARGEYVAGPVVSHPFLGVSGDGSALFGLVGDPYPCLAKLDPIGFTQLKIRCDLELTSGFDLYASPDLNWLVAVGAGRVDLYDLYGVWTEPVPTATWPIPATSAAWLPDGSFVVGAQDKVVHLSAEDPDRREDTPLLGEAGAAVRVMADLRS
jgi:hypothetical protein